MLFRSRYFLPAAEIDFVDGRLPFSFFRVERFLLVRLFFLEPFLRRRVRRPFFRRFFVPRRRLRRRPPVRRRRRRPPVVRRRRFFVILPFENLLATFLRSRFVIPFQRLTSVINFFLLMFFSFFFLAVARSHFFPSLPKLFVLGRAVDAEAERTRRRTRRAIFSQERVSSERVGCQDRKSVV